MLHVEGSHHRLFTFILLSFLLLLGATPVESSDTNRISTDPYHHISRLPLFQETIAGKQHENPGNDEIFVNQYLFGFHQTKFGSGYHFSIKENLNRHKRRFFEAPYGSLKIARGDQNQDYDFIVLVRSASKSEQALTCVKVSNITQERTGMVLLHPPVGRFPLRKPDENRDKPVGCGTAPVQVDIVLFVKPYTLQLGETTLTTKSLNISFQSDLSFETYNMFLESGYGTITGTDNYAFTAHRMNAGSQDGDIVGRWSLPSSLILRTDTGNIDVNVVPKRWSSGPDTPGNMMVESAYGNVSIRMPFATDKLSLRNGTTSINAGGNIHAELVHCGETYLLADHNITATLLPYWEYYVWQGVQYNYITTRSKDGNTSLEVLFPVIDSYYKLNPLHFMHSRHTVYHGSMRLTYPGEWGGVATGKAGPGGKVEVTGEDFEEVSGNENKTEVEVKRWPLNGKLWFDVQDGDAELILKGCGNWRCVGGGPGRNPHQVKLFSPGH